MGLASSQRRLNGTQILLMPSSSAELLSAATECSSCSALVMSSLYIESCLRVRSSQAWHIQKYRQHYDLSDLASCWAWCPWVSMLHPQQLTLCGQCRSMAAGNASGRALSFWEVSWMCLSTMQVCMHAFCPKTFEVQIMFAFPWGTG